MTDKSILQRYAMRNGDAANGNATPADVEGTDDLGAFGWLRGIRDRAVSLELRKKDGNILAVSYGYMDKAEFDPSEGITVSVGGQKIRIKGRNLNAPVRPTVRLFEGITRHRVPWIREAAHVESMHADDNVTIIDSLDW
ncbi:MAG: hypothetical protein BroJett003_01560 [Planctomycetota bacterium]|nr:MAG: hypothetical protein BroJett003_01560 [Planctomycetota bacterium]